MDKARKESRFLMERSEGVVEDNPLDYSTDVLVDDYKDLPIEMVQSSREKKLWWMGVDD
jgi:hypothetical protein